MKNHPYFSWATMAIAWLCLCVAIQTAEARDGSGKPVAKRQQKAPDKEILSLNTDKQAKILDLSVPFTAHDNKWPVAVKKSTSNQPSNTANFLFASASNPPQAQLQLKGGWIMSQEPEAEKRKSAEGAGIVINLRQ